MLPSLVALAQIVTTLPPHARVVRAPVPLVLDGRIEDAWRAAPEQDGFIQKFPNERERPVGRTSFRVMYDDSALYFAIVCEQRGVPVTARFTRRDREIESDWVSVGIDTRGDGRTAVELKVNAAGVLSDAIIFNDNESDPDWDETWDARTARTAEGWSAEIRVPLRMLRYASGGQKDWGLQVRRYTSLVRETDEWSYIPRSAAGEVSRYGRLDGAGAIRGGGFFELRPFVVGRVDRSDPGRETLGSGTAASASFGLDAKWHAKNDLTLDATVLPDFAQVEADRLLLNLTNVEIELPEKRLFFFEGRDIFATPMPLLYTRRIGRIAAAPPELSPGEALVDPPGPARLLGATKLSGRIAEGLRVGSLSALTEQNQVTLRAADGRRFTRAVEPQTLFQVLRLRQELPGNATIGTFTSAVVRADDASLRRPADAGSVCPDGARIPAGGRCSHDSYVGAVDGRWRSADGDWAAQAQVVGTALRDGPPRRLRDGTVVKSGDLGIGGAAIVAKEGGLPWVGEVGYEVLSRKIDFNDAGFMERQNTHRLESGIGYRTLSNWFITRETNTRLELFARTNVDGLVIGHGYQLNTEWKLKNFWQVFVEAQLRPRRFDDREVGDGTALERHERIGGGLWLKSDPRRVVAFDLGSEVQPIFGGGIGVYGEGTATFRITPQLDVALLPQIVYAAGEPRFVGRDPGSLLFGRLEASQISGTLRATYTFTPRLSLQTYLQAFFAAGHYDAFSRFAAPTGRGVVASRRDLVASAPPAESPDFVDAALNANVVLRWEYLLGSTVYLVYTRIQSPRVELLPGQRGMLDFAGIGRAPATDTILLKLTYFFG